MLFTVNVETSGQPYLLPLRNLTVDQGVKTQDFVLNKGKIHYQYDTLPHESETGFEVIPGKNSLELILEMFSKCVGLAGVLGSRVLQYKDFHWPGHVYANQPVYVQFTVERVTPRLQCTDINWKGQLKNHAGDVACEITIKQRAYTRP